MTRKLLPMFLLFLSLNAQGNSGCTLELPGIDETFEEVSYADQSQTLALKNKKFLKLLQNKGYDSINIVNGEDWKRPTVSLNIRIFLNYQVITCAETSWLSLSEKWECSSEANEFRFVAVENGKSFSTEITLEGPSKTSKDLESAQEDLLVRLKKALPSCADVKNVFSL